ncbi:MAG: hypothetical protein A3K19_12080 [Lentisphaerae bacterium RIFOXYB12_FULL_65_16]|nr:MAG: hypothetical protein A3K18_14475 [Lentisphaerae bacterium RIFOXYA12_64_32]OGV86215.1 MAG: hypothetical protein A3K19_12080 [Lentisphaerae bacterium RIFOXYB12_FULL_65_16]
MSIWSQKLSRPPYTDMGEDQHLSPIFGRGAPTLAGWKRRRKTLLRRWQDVLGSHSMPEFDRTEARVEEFELPEAHATLFRLPTSPATRQLALLLRPKTAIHRPCPGAIVPFYNPDLMAGYDLATRQPKERSTTHFGRHLVQQGYVVLCTQAFPFNTVPDPKSDANFAWWHAAAAKVLGDNPHWTGMGKLIWDTWLGTDFLLRQPDVDAERILIIGHSLGGKMAFYNGALDERIKAVIASDFGIGYSFTNWQDPWYLGTKVHDPRLGVGHHELLALTAPRAFLLIAGLYDKRESWQYLNEAAKVYALHGREHALGMFDHASGHTPTEESMRIAYEWLTEQFGLPPMPWQV